MIKLAFAKRYIYELPPGHRFPIAKYDLVKEQLVREGYFTEDLIEDPGTVKEEDALLTHTPTYWQKLHEQSLSPSEIRKIGLPIHDQSVLWAKNAAAGAIYAAVQALEQGIGLSLAGGTHHAYSNHGEGFCILNDVAVASNYLLHKGLAKKILILDLDVHQGNGSAAIFANDQRVFTFSMHGKDNYPLTKERSDWDIPLPTHMSDNEYLTILKSALKTLFDKSLPDIVFYIAGVDVLESDALGKLSLTRQGCKQREEMVLSACFSKQIPVAITMGGGYSPKISDIVEAHSNTFKTALDIFR
jgi:acetoin utilization deacetylase AcuC-like enzyme